MILEWIPLDDSITDQVISEFDCGNQTFNDFLQGTEISDNARTLQSNCIATTYVAIKDNNLSAIYGYASINTTGLLTKTESPMYLPCAEIKMFAVSRKLRGEGAVDEKGIRYSNILFSDLIIQLYLLATKTIAFSGIFLNSNADGYKLYTEHGFLPVNDYVTVDKEQEVCIDGCTPLLLSLTSEKALDVIFN